jgi:hypothetical protein
MTLLLSGYRGGGSSMEAALLERRQQRGGDTIGEDGALASSGVAGGRACDAVGAHWRMGARCRCHGG